ncbi:MAG: type III-B CRISPR module RAMP protein Cmr1 [Candidatus Calescibacterium sp.]|nr:type III-B CRISPR module RAMP protein Cmr1 [Candidatus Calescibacterium sp.]MDW8133291.1 type III-B CRISPR module RAMP protein Cmr1 [Candidatus Calescibacterium sp.]
MKTIEFDLQIITPLFMGNAYQKAELRTQSFNGLIRYWYRLLGGRKETEDRIFGTANQKRSSKGRVIMKISSQKLQIKEFQKHLNKQGIPVHGSGTNYLGFSLHHKPKDKPEVRRQYIDVGQSFKLIFSFHPTLSENEIKQFLCAFWCSIYLGNFGSRSRRGFGSIICTNNTKSYQTTLNINDFNLSFYIDKDLSKWYPEQLRVIQDLNCWSQREGIPYIFQNMEIYRLLDIKKTGYRDWISEIHKNRTGKRLVNEPKTLNKNENDAINLLDYMGFLLNAYRSYYMPDYSEVKNFLQNPSKETLQINRVCFGLPLNFFYSSIGKSFRFSEVRRASPLMMKILMYNSKPQGLIIIFNPIVNGKYSYYFDPKSKNNWNKIYIPDKDIEITFDGFNPIIDFVNSLLNKKIIEKIDFRRQS